MHMHTHLLMCICSLLFTPEAIALQGPITLTTFRVKRSGSLRLNSIPSPVDTFSSGLASIFRLPRGVSVIQRTEISTAGTSTTVTTGTSASASAGTSGASEADDPLELATENLTPVPLSNQQPTLTLALTLHDVENNCDCRIVRETLTELDLNFKVVPSAPNSRVFLDRSFQYALPSGAIIPRLTVSTDYDCNDDSRTISGAKNIVPFLNQFVQGESDINAINAINAIHTINGADVQQSSIVLSNFANRMASFMRIGRGCRVSAAATASDNAQLLSSKSNSPNASSIVLYSYEGNQFCRLVREVMTELDIVYEVRSVGKGSPRRKELAQMTVGGSTQCPCLMDANTGVTMQESADIIQYLYSTYGKFTPPNELLQFVSETILPVFRSVLATIANRQAGEMELDYQDRLEQAIAEIELEKSSALVVLYTYELSPFCAETKTLLDRARVPYKEISLGKEWFPGFLKKSGAEKRAGLLAMTGQSSLPHVFLGGQSIGGLFDGTPGLVNSFSDGSFWTRLDEARLLRGQLSSAINAFE